MACQENAARANTPALHQSQVQEQVSRSQRVAEKLQSKMKSLYERLQPVLIERPDGPSQAGVGPTLVGHAMALSNHNDQLEMLDVSLGDILDRLDL